MNNLKYIDSFLLNEYIKNINDFCGEIVIEEVNKHYIVDKKTLEFFEKLSRSILLSKSNSCNRKCYFRKNK